MGLSFDASLEPQPRARRRARLAEDAPARHAFWIERARPDPGTAYKKICKHSSWGCGLVNAAALLHGNSRDAQGIALVGCPPLCQKLICGF